MTAQAVQNGTFSSELEESDVLTGTSGPTDEATGR